MSPEIPSTTSEAENDLATVVIKLFRVSTELLEPIPFKEDDHFAFMALCFSCKQIEHMSAILTLVDRKLYRDAGLIARSMMEGLVQLVWASNDPELLALQWRQFSAVSNWRRMRKMIEAGHEIKAEVRTRIVAQLTEFGPRFYTKKAKKLMEENKPFPADPYWDNWTGQSYARIFHDVGGRQLHLTVYSPLSAWHHWSPESFDEPIIRDKVGYEYGRSLLWGSSEVLACGFECLFETVSIVDTHLGLGMNARLSALRESYRSFHGRATDQGRIS